MLQAIVLDFDGVIANSEPLHLQAFQDVLAEDGHALSAREYYDGYVGLDDRAMFETFARDRGFEALPAWVDDLITRKTARLLRALSAGDALFPGAAERIRNLAAAVPLAVASGALRHEILQVLEGAGLSELFVVIVAAGETPRGKPAPDPYTRALELLAEHTGRPIDPARAVAVEDTVQGLAAARAARLRTVALTTTYPAEALGAADLILPDLAAVTLSRLASLFEARSDARVEASGG